MCVSGALSAEQEAKMKKEIDEYNFMLKQSFEEKERLAQEMAKERQASAKCSPTYRAL